MKYISKKLLAFVGVVSVSSCSMVGQPVVPKQYINEPEALLIHNKFRAMHHAPALVWDNKLANYAENHARKCRFQHSHSPYGENLAAGYSSISTAVSTWYAEKNAYSYWHPGFSGRTGHFTQLVWKASKRLGCGYAVCNGKNGTPGKFWVCEYSPAGNVVNHGYFMANVLPA